MQLRFFAIPVLGGDAAADALNLFLASHRILAVDRQLTQDEGTALWAICVSYEPLGGIGGTGGPAAPKRGKVDYREVLSGPDFNAYAALRTLRKELAEADGVPVYALFTNDQMAEMVTRRVDSLTALRAIPGIGEARADKYGAVFLETLSRALALQPTEAGGAESDEAQPRTAD